MKIPMLYEQGDAKIIEDKIICNLPFVGVADGVSGLYHPDDGPRLFHGLSGGQMATQALYYVAQSCYASMTLQEVVLWANDTIMRKHQNEDIPLDRSDLLAGATFSLAKIGEKDVEVIQAGDSFALWQMTTGEYGITRNQVFAHDMECRNAFGALLKKHGGDKVKTWKEFTPFISQLRLERVNKNIEKGYGLLNGQPALKDCWTLRSFSLKDLARLILFTDGFIHYPESEGNCLGLAYKITTLYKEGGLERILFETRMQEDFAEEGHIRHAEATAIAIEF